MRAIVACCAVLLLVGAGAQTARARPRVTLVGSQPVAVIASGFRAHERVTVEVRRAGGRARRSVTVSAAGRVSVTFRAVRVSRCAALTVVATGASGLHAALHRRPSPACGLP